MMEKKAGKDNVVSVLYGGKAPMNIRDHLLSSVPFTSKEQRNYPGLNASSHKTRVEQQDTVEKPPARGKSPNLGTG